jgi:hypothetical protein
MKRIVSRRSSPPQNTPSVDIAVPTTPNSQPVPISPVIPIPGGGQTMSRKKALFSLPASPQDQLSQAILFLGIGVGIILINIFLLFPGLIRISIALKGVGDSSQSDVLPPRVPVFSALPTATNSAQLELAGFAEPNSEITLVENGSEDAKTQSADDGAFAFTLNLEEGDNTYTVYSRDSAGNESSVSREVVIRFDQTSPQIAWDQPANEQTVRNLREQNVQVSGQVAEKATITLNDRIVFLDSQGQFTDTFPLQQGSNELTLRVTDEAGNVSEEKRTVFFRP